MVSNCHHYDKLRSLPSNSYIRLLTPALTPDTDTDDDNGNQNIR